MNQLLTVYALIFVLILVMTLLAMRNDGTLSQRLARARVRIDESHRRAMPEPPDEDLGPARALELLVLSIILLFICMLLSRV
jgi:hypothetical protein